MPVRLVLVAAPGQAGLQPTFLLWPTGRESWRPYTLMSYTGDDLLYILLPGRPSTATPAAPATAPGGQQT